MLAVSQAVFLLAIVNCADAAATPATPLINDGRSSVALHKRGFLSKDSRLVEALEQTPIVGFLPAVAHAVNLDRNRALRAVARCAGATSYLVMDLGIRTVAPDVATIGSQVPLSAATSTCVNALGIGSLVLVESTIADMISDPRIRRHCRRRSELLQEMTISAVLGGLHTSITGGIVAALRIFSNNINLDGLDVDPPISRYIYSTEAERWSDAVEPNPHMSKRDVAVDFESNKMFLVPASFAIIPAVIGENGERIPADLRLTTRMLWVLTETQDGPAINVLPLNLKSTLEVAQKMELLELAGVASVLHALHGADYTESHASGRLHRWNCRLAVGKNGVRVVSFENFAGRRRRRRSEYKGDIKGFSTVDSCLRHKLGTQLVAEKVLSTSTYNSDDRGGRLVVRFEASLVPRSKCRFTRTSRS